VPHAIFGVNTHTFTTPSNVPLGKASADWRGRRFFHRYKEQADGWPEVSCTSWSARLNEDSKSAMAQNLSLRTPRWQQVLTLVPPACQAFSPEFARISPETNWGCSYLWSALVLITGSLDSVPDSVAAPAQTWPSRSLSGNNASRGTIADETVPGRLSR